MNRQDVLNLIETERENTARAMSKVLQEERTIMLGQAVKERELHVETRARSIADRKRMRQAETAIKALTERADLSDRVAPLQQQVADLRAKLAEADDRATRPALPAPEPQADEIAEMRKHRSKKEAANG